MRAAQTKKTMWKPKDGEIVFSLRVTKDFRFTSQKQAITKAEIAEKLGMNVQDFEIIEEENEENE